MTSENAGTVPATQSAERRRNRDQEDYFNNQFQARPVYIEAGQAAWSNREEDMIVATVGAGVLVSVYDRELCVGAVGYTLIPTELIEAFPYFDSVDPGVLEKALQPVVDCIGHMKRQGASKKRIYVRLTGGAAIPGDTKDSGTKNYVFVREYVTRKGLTVLNEDLGGSYVRRLHFFPTTGYVVRRMLRREADFVAIRALEAEHHERLASS
jgi:chemotaxis protein CheD